MEGLKESVTEAVIGCSCVASAKKADKMSVLATHSNQDEARSSSSTDTIAIVRNKMSIASD